MIPKQLIYNSKIQGAPAKSIKTNFQPEGSSTYRLGETIKFNIPTNAGSVLVPSESYLKFTLMAMTATANLTAIRLDACGAHGLIQRVKITQNGNVLEDIDNYGMLAKIMFDLQVSQSQSQGKYSVMCGTRSDYVTDLTALTDVSSGDFDEFNDISTYIHTFLRLPFKTKSIHSGQLIENSNGSYVLSSGNTTSTYTYSLNLLSLVGSLCPQYLPLFAMHSAPLTIEITLVDSLIKALNTTAGIPTASDGIINNVEFVGQMIELSDQAMAVVNGNLKGQPLQFVFPDYKNFAFSYVASNNAVVNVAIPANYNSLKSLFMSQRDKQTGALTFFPYSSVKFGLSSYQFKFGSSLIPSSAPKSRSEMFSELMKSIGSLSDLNHHPSIDKESYELSSSIANTYISELNGASSVQSGSFYIGLDVESFAAAEKDSYFAGLNTNYEKIYAVLNFGTVPTNNTPLRSDCFAHFDSLLICDKGVAYVKF